MSHPRLGTERPRTAGRDPAAALRSEAHGVARRGRRPAASREGLWGTPLGKILALALVLRLAGLFWGLPNADGWDDDGVAPRDFLPGVMQTYAPGQHYTYPPLQLIILALVSAPVWIATLLHAPSLSPGAVVTTFINVPTMTALAVIGRFVSACLSLGLLWNVAKIGEELRGSTRAGAWVAAACALDATYTYYWQTTNLDGPYLFWGVWSLRWLVHAIVHRKPSALRRSLLLAALSVATKDQAYALFVLGVPITLAAWLVLDPAARALWRTIAKEVAIGSALALVLLLVVDGAVFNPSGFHDRLRFLLGAGARITRTTRRRGTGAPISCATSAVTSISSIPSSSRRSRRWASRWPCAPPTGPARGRARLLFAAVSFTIAFDMVARRTEVRFALPQSIMVGVYIGLAFDALQTWLAGRFPASRRSTWGFAVAAAPLLAMALFGCLAVDVAMLLDPRYDAEAWLGAHLRPGDRVEVYDNNVHLPRFPAQAVVERVDTTPVTSRNPLLNVREVEDRFSNVEARRPDFIVVSDFWASKYLVDPEFLKSIGIIPSVAQVNLVKDSDSRTYFRALLDGALNYRRAHLAVWTSTFWPRVDIHASLAREVWIFERNPGT